jgi:uncharacterized glyoxalase superfamily protein PhnB
MAIQLETTGITPGITVNDLEKSIDFYVNGLGFTEDARHDVNGKLQWVMLKCGQGRFGLSRDDFAKGRNRAKGVATRFYITTTQDLHALVAQVKAAGGTVDQEPTPTPWGSLACEVSDLDGFKFTLSNGAP